ncbi:hypothetical protein D3C87_1392880 [compost metagenome]
MDEKRRCQFQPLPQMLHQRRQLRRRNIGSDEDGGGIFRFAENTVGAVARDQGMNKRRTCQGLADARHQKMAGIGGQHLSAQQQVANVGVAAMPLGNAAQRKRCDEGVVVL